MTSSWPGRCTPPSCQPTPGREPNAIAAVHASYATVHGHALVERKLYVQAEWFTDPKHPAAGFDTRHASAVKSQMARDQARRALDDGLRPAWPEDPD